MPSSPGDESFRLRIAHFSSSSVNEKSNWLGVDWGIGVGIFCGETKGGASLLANDSNQGDGSFDEGEGPTREPRNRLLFRHTTEGEERGERLSQNVIQPFFFFLLHRRLYLASICWYFIKLSIFIFKLYAISACVRCLTASVQSESHHGGEAGLLFRRWIGGMWRSAADVKALAKCIYCPSTGSVWDME